MKKKIFYGILFSAILAINVISISKTDVSDFSLRSLMQTAKADGESGTGSSCYSISSWQSDDTEQCDSPSYYSSGIVRGEVVCHQGDFGDCQEGYYCYNYSCDGTMVGVDANDAPCKN